MTDVLKVIRRFVGMLFISFLCLLFFNLLFLGLAASQQAPNRSPWITAQTMADSLQPVGGGGYTLPGEMLQQLQQEEVWAVFIDNASLQAVWQSPGLPEEVPQSYTAADIAGLTRGYIADYPTFTGAAPAGLMVLGYPKTRYWKHLWPSWDYPFIAHLPQQLLALLGINLVLICIIYCAINSKLLKSIKPITDGIRDLGACRPVYIRQRGPLGEIARNINRASERLQSQGFQLRRKEAARASWIAGVSHDMRTPLSMVMGYAARLQADPALDSEQKRRASVILRQSERMKQLIDDLNLVSRLEYHMQPLHCRPENAVSLVRQAAVDLLNLQEEGRYAVCWETPPQLISCTVCVDGGLLRRAVTNLLQNCMSHNEGGCTLYLSVREEGGQCILSVEDDGSGVSRQELERLQGISQPVPAGSGGHGLGLMIVRQIAAAHGGGLVLGQSGHGGFAARLTLPLSAGQESGGKASGNAPA